MNYIKNHMTKIKTVLPILSFLCMLGHFGVVKNRDKVTFHWPESPRLYQYGILALAFVTCFLLYLAFFIVLYLILTRNREFLSYFQYFCLYAAIMGIFFLMTWPGIFKGDEFYVIKSALSFSLSPAQSGLTSIFYIVALLIFPSMATIPFLQLLVICSIFAYIMKNIRELFPSRKSWCFLLVFLLLPVIDGNLFTLRATLVGWIFLWIICGLYFASKKKVLSTPWFFALSALSGLIMAWRSEYLYLLLLLPIACLWLRLIHFKKMLFMVLVIAISFMVCNVPNKIALNGSNKYPISLVLNPIANLFTEVEDLKGPDVYDDVMTINELVDVQLLRRSASVRNISQYWNIEDILPKEQLSRFMKASIRLILYNPDKFFKYRVLTFLHTNGFYPDEINHPGGENVDAINRLYYYDMDYKAMFVMMDPPFGQSLREKCISFLACRHYDIKHTTTNALLPVFYNCLPTLVFLLAGLIASILKRKKVMICLILLTLAQVILIFLTAPAMFFMYYFCFYLAGYFTAFLCLFELHRIPDQQN